MADPLNSSRFSLRQDSAEKPHGAWWPESRILSEQLTNLFDVWPKDRCRIARILYSSPDWDDRPHAVQVAGRRVKSGTFPHDDTQELTLVLQDGQRRTITVIPPDTSPASAKKLLDNVALTRGASHE